LLVAPGRGRILRSRYLGAASNRRRAILVAATAFSAESAPCEFLNLAAAMLDNSQSAIIAI
jgi:hypothetical protein